MIFKLRNSICNYLQLIYKILTPVWSRLDKLVELSEFNPTKVKSILEEGKLIICKFRNSICNYLKILISVWSRSDQLVGLTSLPSRSVGIQRPHAVKHFFCFPFRLTTVSFRLLYDRSDTRTFVWTLRTARDKSMSTVTDPRIQVLIAATVFVFIAKRSVAVDAISRVRFPVVVTSMSSMVRRERPFFVRLCRYRKRLNIFRKPYKYFV